MKVKNILAVSLVAVMAVAGARADIASTTYVDNKVVAGDVNGAYKNLKQAEKEAKVPSVGLTEALVLTAVGDKMDVLDAGLNGNVKFDGEGNAITGVTANGNGDVTFVKGETFATQSDYDTLNTTVSGHTTSITNLNTTVNKLDGDVNTNGSVKKQISDAINGVNTNVTGLTTRVVDLETDNTTNKTNIAANAANITALQAAVGGTSVEDQIDTALKDYTTTTNLEKDYAKKAATLAGYGIGDAYTKTEVDTAVDAKQAKSTAANQIGNGSGGWTTLTTDQMNAINSGATTANIGQIATNTTAITTLNGADNVTGSVAQKIKAAVDPVSAKATANETAIDALMSDIDALDFNMEAADGVVKTVTQENGQISVTTAKIKNDDVDANAAIAQSKISGLEDALTARIVAPVPTTDGLNNGKYVLTYDSANGGTYYWEKIGRE